MKETDINKWTTLLTFKIDEVKNTIKAEDAA